MIALFWDIDGTLLTTGKAGVPAWEMAVREIVQRDFELASFRVAGLTDYQIAVRTFEMLDVDADESTIRRMVLRYEELLPEELPKKRGHVMPNVREILERLADEADVHSYLLTGNTPGGARAKLTHYDLFKYFEGGAFAEDSGDRASIAARALALARRNAPVGDDSAFVIGDTPHDIECANAIGARTIAVSTGGYSRAELMKHRPWRVFDTLPPADEFARLIRKPRGGAAETRPA
ncbi:MAG TPA: HAD hydrolase-like protein [Vicinamibacterales bacterium]|nr:HAD hydrolase-like protein [Vicinamibacterales bacterium]